MYNKRAFKDKVALITGASKGIGRAIAIELADLGVRVVLNGRDQTALKNVQEMIVTHGGTALYHVSDITDSASCKELIMFVIRNFDRIDILINNAGISMRGFLSELNYKVIDDVYRTNLISASFLSAMALPYVRQNKGSIVFVSSAAGIRGLPYQSIYCASKMALRALAEAIRIEEYKNEVHVGLVYVGTTENDPGKTTLGANGKYLVLKDRVRSKVLAQSEVAKEVVQNISRRQFVTTLSFLGKLNLIVQRLSPRLGEYILIRNINRILMKSE